MELKVIRARRRQAVSDSGQGEDGFSLIELLVAGAILTVGFLALLILVTTAMANNTRSRTDTSGVMLAQSVIEEINYAVTTSSGTATLTDCTGNSFTVNSAVGGAALSGTSIDYSETSPPANYHMNFVICSGTQQVTYDVRWNIQALSAGGYTSALSLVTIGAKMRNTSTSDNLRFFTLPLNMRALVGQ